MVFYLGLGGDKKISIHLSNWDRPYYTTRSRKQVVEWFARNTKDIFPDQQQSGRIDRREDFYTLQYINHGESKIESISPQFKEIIDKSLIALIPRLKALADTKKPVIQNLRSYERNLEKRINDLFPKSEGWIFESNPWARFMDHGGLLSIYKSDWANVVKITIQFRDNFFCGMIFGLLRAIWNQKY